MTAPDLQTRLRALPAVDRLLGLPDSQALVDQYGREATVQALRAVLDDARRRIMAGDGIESGESALLAAAESHLAESFLPTLRGVINATGVVIHTNLGRAPLSQSAQDAIRDAAASYSTLEFDLESGGRGSRSVHAEALLTGLTGAGAALVVNNNASAMLLMLVALAAGREVIVSRGQLVEIGGGFRMPDVMAQGGARLIEVGTTNRTRLADYEGAIGEETALLLRVHASNFKQMGFVESTSLADMAALAHRHGLLCGDDLGSGALVDTAAFGLEHEPTVQESLQAGCDVVAFSGDKLLGGPQAGILAGKREVIDRLKRHPLARAVRADKLCLAALCATLDHYRRGEAVEKAPVLWMLNRPLDSLRATAQGWADALNGSDAAWAQVIDGESTVGGGSLPGETLPTALLALSVPSPDAAAAKLRAASVPVIARIGDGRLLLDPRTVLPGQDAALLDAVRGVRP